MADSTLTSLLSALHDTVQSNKTTEANQLLDDLRSVCPLAQSETGLSCSLLFKRSNNILQFIQNINKLTEFNKSKENCLEIISDIITRGDGEISRYITDITETCVAVFQVDRSSSNREKSLQIIIKLVELRQLSCESKKLNVLSLRKLCNLELAKKTGATATVKSNCLHLLGVLAQFYPEDMIDYSERLFDIFLRELRKEMQSKKSPDLKLIAGCLRGLTCLMVNFTKAFDESPDKCREIYKFLIMSIQPRTDLTRYAIPIAGMQMMQNHASQFGELLIENYEEVYNSLHKWFSHTNYSLRHEAHMAINSYLSQVVVSITAGADASRAKQLFYYFGRKFQEMLDVPDISSKALSVALHGYGLFAGLCRRYMQTGDVQKLFSTMIWRCERLYLGRKTTDGNQLHQLPSFLLSLSSIIREMMRVESDNEEATVITSSFEMCLCRLCVLAIKEYPSLNQKFSYTCCRSLISIMSALSSCPDLQRNFVSKVVYQGLIRCCSSAVFQVAESDLDSATVDADATDLRMDSRSYEDYLSLWTGLICPVTGKGYHTAPSFSRSEQKYVQELIYHEILTTLIAIISKLDLSSSSDQEGNVDDNLEGDVEEPGDHVDLRMFNNVIDFSTELLPAITIPVKAAQITGHIFEERAAHLIKELLSLTTKIPSVSGFYRLLAMLMDICTKLIYFKQCSSSHSKVDVMEQDSSLDNRNAQKNQCLFLLRKFVLEVISHLFQWKDELLSCALLFITSLPSEVAQDILPDLVSPLQKACQLGLTHGMLAESAIDAMERWREGLEPKMVEVFVPVMLCFEPFLHVTASKPDNQQDLEKNPLGKKSKGLSLQKDSEKPMLPQVRYKVIRYLGNIGGVANRFLEYVANLKDSSAALMVWDGDVSIPYAVPFQEMKLDVQLESLLPSVTELALQSANRQTKVAACEFLHSVTVYMIGRSAEQDSTIRKQNPVSRVYRHLCLAILKLACDVDQVSRQLFKPLVMQMIHWFTTSKEYGSPETTELLDAILNGLIDEHSGSLRHLCGFAVKEFLVWSIKQDIGTKNTARINAKSLFKKLFNLARHPSPGKRFGAAIAFNRFYSIFREEEALVDEFTFEFLVTTVESLAIAHSDHKAMGTQKECVELLTHIERIVQHKKELFNKESTSRIIPSGFSRNKPIVLSHVVDWLLKQCGCPQDECRHQCMKLCYSFIPLLPGSNSATQWMREKKDIGGGAYLLSCFEGAAGKVVPLYPPPKITGQNAGMYTAMMHWFDALLASLDCYCWVFQQKLLMPKEIFQGDRHNIFRSCEFFLRNVVRLEMDEVMPSNADIHTPHEQNAFAMRKSMVLVRILQFSTALLRSQHKDCFAICPETFWETETLLGVVASAAVDHLCLGFSMDLDLDIASELPLLVIDLMSLMCQHLPFTTKVKFTKELCRQIFKNGVLLDQLRSPSGEISLEQASSSCSSLIQAYIYLHQSKLLIPVLLEGQKSEEPELAKELLSAVFHSLVTNTDEGAEDLVLVDLSVEAMAVASKLLKLALELGCDNDLFIKCLADSTPLWHTGGRMLATTHGQVFFSSFKLQICHKMCTDSSLLRRILQFASNSTSTCFSVVNGILEHLETDSESKIKYSGDMCRVILTDWKELTRLIHYKSPDVNSHDAALNLFIRILTLYFTDCKTPSGSIHDATFEMFCGVLISQTIPFSSKIQVLSVLTFFHAPHNKVSTETMRASLIQMSGMHFPMNSKELVSNTGRQEDYVSAVKQLLLCLELTGNIAVLEVLISIMCREEEHILWEDFQTALQKCLQNVDDSLQKDVLDVPYRIFSKTNNSQHVPLRCKVIYSVFSPLSSCCGKNAANEFFTACVGDIMTNLLEDHYRASNERWKVQLSLKSCYYRLAEIMFSSLPAETFKSDSSPLVNAFASSPVGKGSTKLLKTFMGRVIKDKNEDMTGQTELMDERRRFHCSVYNALIAAILCTQTEVKWFDAFLFSDNPSKKEFLFDNIVSKTCKYSFPREQDDLRFISVRLSQGKESMVDGTDVLIPFNMSLSGCSLSEDVDQFDNNVNNALRSLRDRSGRSQPTEGELMSQRTGTLRLEKDELNEHECMSNLVSLLMHMKEKKIGHPEMTTHKDLESSPFPKWMTVLMRKMISSTCLNVKIFCAKLVLNCEQVIRPFASHWILPLLKVILSYFNKNSEHGIDQFVVDVMATLLSWRTNSKPENITEEKHLTKTLLEYLMRYAKHENRSLLQQNLELFKVTLECWRDSITEINTDIVYQQIMCTDPKSMENYTGLQLLGTMLMTGLPSYTSSSEVTRSDYFQRICDNMLSGNKIIGTCAAEVMGMSLKSLGEDLNHQATVEDVKVIVTRVLKKLATPGQGGTSAFGTFVLILHKLTIHHPPVAEPFLAKLLFNMPKLPSSDVQTCCIDILCLCVDKIPNLLAELKAKNFISMLVHRNETLQRSCLRLCTLLSKHNKQNQEKNSLSSEELKYHKDCTSFILPPIEKSFRNHPDPLCRQEVYNLAMEVFDIEKSLPAEDRTDNLMVLAKIILLRGLKDPEEILRTQIFNYWTEENPEQQRARLPQDPAGKVVGLLSELYQPGIDEAGFLTSICNLLLQSSSRSPDFERPIFQHPLSECTFQELPIMTPAISNTMRSSAAPQIIRSDAGTYNKSQQNMLKATMVENQFSATVNDVEIKNTYNWMTGNSIETFSSLDVSGQSMAPLRQQKGHSIIAAKKRNPAQRQLKPLAPNFGKILLEGEPSTGVAVHSDFRYLQRRLRKDTRDPRIRFAVVAMRKRKQKERLAKQQQNRNLAVRMYRSYRIGELPDIEIPHRALITPLAALAQLNLAFSRRLLSSLLDKIIKHQVVSGKTEYVDNFIGTISQIMMSSERCNPMFIGCIMHFVYMNASVIKLDPSTITRAATRSGQNLLGARVLEEWLLIEQQENEEPVSKRRKVVDRPKKVTERQAMLWVELARLHKGDFDVMQGIFVGTPVARSVFVEAIQLESRYEFAEASKVYQKALLKEDWDPEPSDVEKDLWEDSLLVCLKKLGKWSDVSKFCDSQMSGTPLDVTWAVPGIQDRFFIPALRSRLGLLLRGDGGYAPELLSLVDNVAKADSERKEGFKLKFADQLAMLYIYQGDYHLAQHHLLKAADAFAADWANTDSSMLARRVAMVNRAQRMSDMSDFVELMKQPDGSILHEAITSLVGRWTHRLPHPTRDPVDAWEDMVAYRSFFLSQLSKRCTHKTSREEQEEDTVLSSLCLRDFLERKKLYFQLEAIHSACCQSHFGIARRLLNEDAENVMEYLQATDSQYGFLQEITMKSLHTAQYCLSYAQHNMSVVRSAKALEKASKALVQAYKILTEDLANDLNMLEVSVKKNMLIGRSCELAIDVLGKDDQPESNILQNLVIFTTNPDNATGDAVEMKKEITLQGYYSIKKSAEDSNRLSGNEEQKANASLAFVKYCDNMLQEREQTSTERHEVELKDLVQGVVKYALHAMKYQSATVTQEASLSFPRLLQLVELYPEESKSCFLKEVEKLPSWMFLRWSSQIVALLDKENADAVHGILSLLVQDYPQAIIYPIKTSMPEFHYTRSDAGKRNKIFVNKLHEKLNDEVPLADVFINNLCLLTSPAHLFKDWQEETMQLLRCKDKTGWNKKMLTKYQNMYADIFACGHTLSVKEEEAALYDAHVVSRFPTSMSAGSYRKNFAKHFQKMVDKEFGGATGSDKLLRMDEKKFRSATAKLVKEMHDYCKKDRPSKLEECSKWLADFSSINLDVAQLEIPGQYTGRRKPNVSYHPMISGFDEDILVMSSLQQPKRIRIKASDGHDYFYLVKGNEDLRQDQRVEQVFEVMNDILSQDSACWERKLHIETYQVIPVTSRLGLIEWVEDSAPLQDVVNKEAKLSGCEDNMNRPPQLYISWLKTYSKSTSDCGMPAKLYGNMLKFANYTDACHKYREIVSQIPQGLLRNAYIRMSSSPEAFLSLRQKFATSYGTLCASHWILGIGDRHTSNCMISKKTGAVVGIDFGHAFGTATEGLPVPELAPFRLSPQLQYLMAPHPIKHGRLRQCLGYSLSAFRMRQETILAILDIFLKEPSVDWMKTASKMLSVHGSGITNEAHSWEGTSTTSGSSNIIRSGSGDGTNVRWYPLRKIGIVKKKLSGWKPSEITQNELQHNYQVPKSYLPQYKAVAAGLENKNVRASHTSKDLSSNEQVDCLIDQATDPNILVRTYVGWRFWL